MGGVVSFRAGGWTHQAGYGREYAANLLRMSRWVRRRGDCGPERAGRVASTITTTAVCWFKDPDGNLLSLSQG